LEVRGIPICVWLQIDLYIGSWKIDRTHEVSSARIDGIVINIRISSLIIVSAVLEYSSWKRVSDFIHAIELIIFVQAFRRLIQLHYKPEDLNITPSMPTLRVDLF
jgi:hypothetical protein